MSDGGINNIHNQYGTNSLYIMLRPSVLTYSTTYARFHPSVLNRHCTPRLNFKYNCGSNFISSKTFTTDVWKKFFRFPSLSYKRCKNFSIIFFFFFFFFSGTDQPEGKKRLTKHLETPSLQQLRCHHTQTYGHIHTYIHTYIMWIFIGACQWMLCNLCRNY